MSLDITRIKNPVLRDFMVDHFDYASRLVNFGTPIVLTDDYIVASANMKVGTYTIAHQPDVPRNVYVTHAIVATGTDTLGTITVVGTNFVGGAISEVITPLAGTTATGLKAFKSITSVTGAGWVIAGGNDTIKVGVGNALGLPFKISATDKVVLGALGVALIAPTVTVSVSDLSLNTVDVSSGTYNGSKKAFAFIVE
jgi:hypothetical protein